MFRVESFDPEAVMTMAEFVEKCVDGIFTDFDGHAFYVDGDMVHKTVVRPSYVVAGTHQKKYTHVVWVEKKGV